MRIRSASAEEAEALAGLAWAAKASWGYSIDQLTAWRDALSPSVTSIAEQPTFVAELGDTLAGFCQLNLEVHPVELEHLWVHPEFMGRGVGRALLCHCLDYLACSGVPLLHIDSDPNAEPFYAACGAVRIGVVAAPVEGRPDRVRPQLRVATGRSGVSAERTLTGKPCPATHAEH